MKRTIWERFDRDGAVAEHGDRALAVTRAQLIGAGLGGAAAVLVGHPAGATAAARGGDEAILNYALSLEYLQAAFYTEAERAGALAGPLAQQARVVGAHERAHVDALRRVLGSAAAKRPAFDFRGATEDPQKFRETAVAFEDLSVAAYKDRLPHIQDQAYLATAVGLHSVEARHAAWIRRLAGVVPAQDAFDDPLPPARVERLVSATRFVAAPPRTRARKAPPFAG